MTRPTLSSAAGCARRLISADDASASVWSIFWMTMMMLVSGLTLDVANAYRVRALLQATADASALAAVRELPDADAARTAAIDLAQVNMPVEGNGTVVLPSMVRVGAWDEDTGSFLPGQTPYDAVQVFALDEVAAYGDHIELQMCAAEDGDVEHHAAPCSKAALSPAWRTRMSSRLPTKSSTCMFSSVSMYTITPSLS